MTSTALKAGAAVGAGYLLYRLVRGTALLLFLVVKLAVLLPIGLLYLAAGRVSVAPPPPARRPVARPAPTGRPTNRPASIQDLGPASVDSTGDWRQDRETLKRLLAEGKIK